MMVKTMATFNKKPVSSKTTNYAGGVAYKPSDKLELMLMTFSSMIGNDTYYVSGETLDNKYIDTIHRVAAKEPEFILKLAYYARSKMHIRSAATMLIGEYALAKKPYSVKGGKEIIAKTIERVDDITELMAYVMNRNEKGNFYKGKIPNVIKRSVALAFTKFDAYQLAKYNRKGSVTLKDAMLLTHPKPKDEKQREVFWQLLNNELPTPDTWEVIISTQGSTAETWEKVVDTWISGDKVKNYMAMIRNLRNLTKVGISDKHVKKVVKAITNVDAILKSKMFPFRFYSAYKMNDNTYFNNALMDAIDISVANVPVFPGVTAIAADMSGSMGSNVSEKSNVTLREISALYGAIVFKNSENARIYAFADYAKVIKMSKKDTTFTNAEKIMNTNVGYGTDMGEVMTDLIANRIYVDRIIILTDMQMYRTDVQKKLNQYRRDVNPNVYVYGMDLSRYGTTSFPENGEKICNIGGWSERIFEFINIYESDKANMLRDIESIEIGE